MGDTITAPTTTISVHQWDVEDLEHLPEGYRYEILEGVLYMSPMPELQHGAVIANLLDLLSPWVRSRKLGRFFPPQTGVYYNKKNYIDPDLLFLRASEYKHWPKRATRGTLAIEVLSPSNLRAPREDREQLFSRVQVEELWYVDTNQRTLDIRQQAEAGYRTVATFQGEDMVRSAVLPGLEFPLTALWEDLDA